MRLAVLADVHANMHALESVIEHLAGEEVTHYVCPGDLVGYGPQPNECIACLRDLGAVCVAGNHDLMAIGQLPLDDAGPLARRTLLWTQTELDGPAHAFLAGLPAVAEFAGTVISHGALGAPTAYVRDGRQAGIELERLEQAHPQASVLVLGHTHRPLAYARRRGDLLSGSQGLAKLPADEAVLLNPGSVGQPRERAPVARFLVLDLERREATFHALRSDVRRCRRELRRRGLPARACHRPPSRLRSATAWVVQRAPRRVRRLAGAAGARRAR